MKKYQITAVVVILCAELVFIVLGFSLFRRNSQSVVNPARHILKSISIITEDSLKLTAWHGSPKGDPQGVLVLVHGVRSSRSAMVNEALAWYDRGFAVLLPDLRAHGESEGDYISYGVSERLDVLASVKSARELYPQSSVGVIGFSLGGASALSPEVNANIDFLIIQSVFSSLERAIENRLKHRFGALAAILMPIFSVHIPLFTGLSADYFKPLEWIKDITVPIYIMNGEKDWRAAPAEAYDLASASGENEYFWIVPNAGHEPVYYIAGEAYLDSVETFIKKKKNR